jgi:hypothetical protein
MVEILLREVVNMRHVTSILGRGTLYPRELRRHTYRAAVPRSLRCKGHPGLLQLLLVIVVSLPKRLGTTFYAEVSAGTPGSTDANHGRETWHRE